MRRLFVDSHEPIYAVGGPCPQKDACLEILAAAARGEVELHASVEMVQEFLFHRMRRAGRENAVEQARLIAAAVVLHDFDGDVLSEALALVERHGMRGRDAVHAATALQSGVVDIVTSDSDFDACPGLRRIEPGDLAGHMPTT